MSWCAGESISNSHSLSCLFAGSACRSWSVISFIVRTAARTELRASPRNKPVSYVVVCMAVFDAGLSFKLDSHVSIDRFFMWYSCFCVLAGNAKGIRQSSVALLWSVTIYVKECY